MKILWIDAWRYDGSWTWNNWHAVGTMEKPEFETLTTSRKILGALRERTILGEESKGKVSIIDDGYNIVICAKGTGEPMYAIEYGPEY